LRSHQAEGLCTRCLLESGLEVPLDKTDAELSASSPIGGPTSDSGHSCSQQTPVRYFGDYELLEEIARGGMGVVYRAKQLSLGRIVALKMILAGPFASKQVIQRFRGEVTAAALLQHPNIVAIHDVGIHDGQHYFSMDYVAGQNLSQLVGTRPLPPAKAARYIKLVAEALQYAHEQGVLHRDLKPSNVLVDTSDQPRITDFGLAKRLDGDSSLTMTGQMLGSPNYMPPEQASSQRGKVGRHSDVYGLGAILYHLLTARPPFQAESFESTIHQVLNVEPVSPRLLNSSVPPDLETICVKCLQKEPSRRYQSVQELADELNLFLRHEPIHARPITRAERAWRWCRRNPVVAGLGVALVLAIVIGFAGITWQLRQLRLDQLIARRNLYTKDMNLAHQAWDEGSLQRAQELLLAHLPETGKEDLRGFEWRYLWKLCQDESRITFANVHFAERSIVARHGLALATDGHTLIAASGATLKWLDCQKQREVQTMSVGTQTVNAVAISVKQPGLVAYRTDTLKAFSPSNQGLLGRGLPSEFGGGCPDPDQDDRAFEFSWDGSLLAASNTKGTVGIFDVATGERLDSSLQLTGKEYVVCLAFSPDAKYLACGTSETKIHVLEMPQLNELTQVKAHSGYIRTLVFDSAGTKLVSGSSDSHLRIWSFPDCRQLADLPGPLGGINDSAFSPDGLRVACVGVDDAVQIWNLANLGAGPTLLHGHRGAVKSVLFSKDGNELYTGSDDGTVKVWDLSAKESSDSLPVSDWSDAVAFSPDGRLAAVTDFTTRNAVLYELPTRVAKGTMGKHTAACRRAKFSPDGQLLATIGGTLQVGEVSTMKTRFERDLAGIDGSLDFHPSKPILAVASGDLRAWDFRDGAPINLLPSAPTNDVAAVAFSPNGEWIALGMNDGEVSIWDVDGGRQLHSFNKNRAAICNDTLSFSHDGRLLAAGGYDNQVVLYNLRTGVSSALGSQKDREAVEGLAFAPDDKTLVSASSDGTIRFWCLANNQVALTLNHDRGPVHGMTFSRDGNLMATSGTGGKAILWPAARLEEIVVPHELGTKGR
jgi:WD40 repeat protein